MQTAPTPQRSVLVVDRAGPRWLEPRHALPEVVGRKAYGLASLPEDWTQPFFVVSAAALELTPPKLAVALERALSTADISASVFIVRSSGSRETMRQRGRLSSRPSSRVALASTLVDLALALPDPQHSQNVHWVVQPYVNPVRTGHLSNERHLSYEARDWVAEFEIQERHRGYTTSIGIRPWRDGHGAVKEEPLLSSSEAQVCVALRTVARWALAFGTRIHFEWVWDGARVWVVQSDSAESPAGVSPYGFRPASIATATPGGLAVFRPATPSHFERYPKLHNAAVYTNLGYTMPPFYVVEAPEVLRAILEGLPPVGLLEDLSILAASPFVLRTDGADLPDDRREMLPRTDELRTPEDASDWLRSFPERIRAVGLGDSQLCLIGHHFIPSVASAWARAEPGRRMVRIESLWGLPEGLYWYSHDTFEVDAGTDSQRGPSQAIFPFRERRRFKGTFIAADAQGNWIRFETAPPFDWRRSIRLTRWISEIASTTRRIADHEGRPVAVMWLVDNDKRRSPHSVLPWYHSSSSLDDLPRAAPRKKLRSSAEIRICTNDDWAALKRRLRDGARVERVVVSPTEPDIVRNKAFADELASVAKAHDIVIELSGGILSHAYYVLQRGGARVECVDLFGADEDVIDFNKVVRDEVPAVIASRGERAETVKLSGDALVAGLRQKLVEEAFEALDAQGAEEIVGELADVFEVVSAIATAIGSDSTSVERERKAKQRRRGGFAKGLVLRKTASPHSLSRRSSAESELPLGDEGASEILISDPDEIPRSPLLRRPDLRAVEGESEKLFSFEGELHRTNVTTQIVEFDLPMERNISRDFRLVVELSRAGPILKATVRLRLLPRQLSLPDTVMPPSEGS